MPSTDLVPCYYTGQRRLVESPAEFRLRSELHQMKQEKLGKFVEHGRVFLFFKVLVEKIQRLWDGPLGIGNLLPFAKAHNYGDKLHYEMPHAGDKGMRRHGLFSRRNKRGVPQLRSRTIRVSGRSQFRTPACA